MPPKLKPLNNLPYEHRGKLLTALLLLVLSYHVSVTSGLKAQLADKPLVEEHKVTRVVQGPTKTVYRTIEKPGAERVVERIVEVASKESEVTYEQLERPIAPPVTPPYRFLAGAVLDPAAGSASHRFAPRVGVTLWGRVDLAYSKTLYGGLTSGHRADIAYRFGQ